MRNPFNAAGDAGTHAIENAVAKHSRQLEAERQQQGTAVEQQNTTERHDRIDTILRQPSRTEQIRSHAAEFADLCERDITLLKAERDRVAEDCEARTKDILREMREAHKAIDERIADLSIALQAINTASDTLENLDAMQVLEDKEAQISNVHELNAPPSTPKQ